MLRGVASWERTSRGGGVKRSAVGALLLAPAVTAARTIAAAPAITRTLAIAAPVAASGPGSQTGLDGLFVDLGAQVGYLVLKGVYPGLVRAGLAVKGAQLNPLDRQLFALLQSVHLEFGKSFPLLGRGLGIDHRPVSLRRQEHSNP